jgi:protocatechuate 3,4-dioxygenase beta subunit
MFSKKKFTKYVALTLLVATPLSVYTPVSAATDKEVKNVQTTQQKDDGNKDYIRVPLVQNVTPSIGSTVVRPDQNVVVQLDKKAPEYNWVSKYIAKGYLSGYVIDAKNNVSIDNNQIKFDAVTGQLTVQHPLLNRNTQYAIVLNIGEQNEQSNQYGYNDEKKKYMDVVTAVDIVAKTATLLGHGTISLATDNEYQYGQSHEVVSQDSGKSHEDKQEPFPYKVGDVVSVHVDKQTGKVNIDNRKQEAVSTLFTTGSALNEATHLMSTTDNGKVRVTDGGKVNVKVTDDYGLPATNAEVVVTSDSANVSAPILTLGVNENGQGVIDITDHKKEVANLTITSKDKTYNDPQNTQKGQDTIEFLSGLPDHMTIKADQNLIVGKSEHVTGTVFDKYENQVENDTIVSATPSSGEITPQEQNSKDGNFDFTFVAPIKLQEVTITAKAGTISYGNETTIKLKADQPANIKLVADAKVIKADGNSESHVSIEVTDQYGNPVDGENVSLSTTGKSGIPSTVTTDASGKATFPVYGTTSGLNEITASTANGIKSPVVSIITATPLTMQNKVVLNATKQIDGSVVVSGEVLGGDGNPVAYTYVPLESTGGALTESVLSTDASGAFTTTLTPASHSTLAKVSVPTASNQPEVAIDPLIYGNQPWTDTGIDVAAGQTVHVVSTGTWSPDLFAQLNGYAIKIGSDGTFIAGASGRLQLGTNGVTHLGDVDSMIYLSGNAEYPAILPSVNFVTDNTSIAADGKSTAKISGRIMAGLNPVVGAVVNITATSGSIPATATSDENGNFSVTYISGTVAQDAILTAKYLNLTQTVGIKLTVKSNLKGMKGYTPPKGTIITATDGGNAPVLIDENMDTVWGGWAKGSAMPTYITMKFPTPQKLSAVHIASQAGSTQYQTFAISGLKDGQWWNIGQNSILVGPWIPVPIAVGGNVNADIKHGSHVEDWDGISIAITGGSPWGGQGSFWSINEITLVP